MAMRNLNPRNTLYCSFCGKSEAQVHKLIAGPTVFICDECVLACVKIIRKEGIDVPSEVGFGDYDLESR